MTNTLESLTLTARNALNRLSTSLNSLVNVVIDNRLALDYFLEKQGGVCVVINKTCCTFVNYLDQIEMGIKKIYEQASWLHSYNQGSDPNTIRSTLRVPSLFYVVPKLYVVPAPPGPSHGHVPTPLLPPASLTSWRS